MSTVFFFGKSPAHMKWRDAQTYDRKCRLVVRKEAKCAALAIRQIFSEENPVNRERCPMIPK